MGTKNRQRRAEKRRRRERAGAERRAATRSPVGDNRSHRDHEGGCGGPDPSLTRAVIFAAADAAGRPHDPAYAALLVRLDDGPPGPGGREQLAVELASCLGEAMRRAWARGWQPADVARVAGRERDARHTRFAVDVMASDAQRWPSSQVPPRWADQLQGLGATQWWSSSEPHLDQWARREQVARIEALATGVELLSLLHVLPPLPRLCDPPGTGPANPRRRARQAGSQDSRMLDRVRGLLAKAESTTFAEEAEALTAKAQELMARHAIDEAMVDAGGDTGEAPVGVRLAVDDPYAPAKSLLLSEVAAANRCRSVWSKTFGFTTVLGFEADIEFVEVLYTSLLVQATTAMVAAGSQVDRYGRSRTRSFRQAFLVAYATRIGQRLRQAEASSRAAATEDYGEALLPVLADRTAAVDAACDATFPGMVTRGLSVTNRAGWVAGSAAAELASLSPRREVGADRS